MKQARDIRAQSVRLASFHHRVFDKLTGEERLELNAIIGELDSMARDLEAEDWAPSVDDFRSLPY